MKSSISSSQNQLKRQPEKTLPANLQPTVHKSRERAIEARQMAKARSIQASYNLGGWKSFFEEYVQPPLSVNDISPEPENSGIIVTSAQLMETVTSTDNSISLSQSNNSSNSRKSTTSVGATMPLCPSARAEIDNAVVFGAVGGTASEPRVSYTTEVLPVNEEILALSEPVTPTEIFRMASPCVANGCQHFDGSNCRLAMRIVEQLPSVIETLPACQIRSNCRWWQQEGKAACLRCPQVVTDDYYGSELFRQVAKP